MAGAAQEPPLSNLSPGRTFGIAALAAVLVGVFWWQPWHQRGKGSAPAETAVNGPAPAASAAADAPPVVSDPAPAGEAPVVAASMPAASPVSEASQGTPPGAGRARLRLSFSADSWVDVHDANGKRAFSGNGLANSVKTITGTAPMHVYLGSANGVALEINDRTVVIGRQFFAGNVARFEAGADGVLRPDAQARPARPRS
jgi:hypothetical protein